ncbi:MAG: amidohydrolase family protein, partial [Rhodoplanes sp.]
MLVSGRVATVIAFIVFILPALPALPALAQNTTAETPRSTLFTNVRVFDGKSATLSDAINVLVRGNVIEKIAKEPISTDRSASTTIVDGKGRTLMPGLIDAHVHMTFSTIPLALIFSADPNYTMLRDGKAAGEMLMRGFTSGRD